MTSAVTTGDRRARLTGILERTSTRVFLVASGLNWVHFGLLPLDSQPWPILAAGTALLSALLARRVPWEHLLFFYAPFAALLVGCISLVLGNEPEPFLLARGILSSVALAVSFAAYAGAAQTSVRRVRWLVAVNVTWLAVGVLQRLTSPRVLEAVATVRTDEVRGVTSLAAEPTFFAVFLIFMSWLLLVEYRYRPPGKIRALVWINVGSIIFLAASAMGFVYLLLAASMLSLYRIRRLLPVAVFGASVLMATLFLAPDAKDSRLLRVIARAEAPIALLRADASINTRVAHVLSPWWATARRATLPGGYHAFRYEYEKFKTESGGVFYWGTGEKIMSWLGAYAFELGFLAIPIYLLIFWCVWDGSRRSVFELAFLAALLASAIPPALPLTGMLIAAMYVQRRARFYNRSAHSLISTNTVAAREGYTPVSSPLAPGVAPA